MILARRQVGRDDQRQLYYKDRQWENSWAGATAEWMQYGTLDANQRAAFFQIAYSSAAAMVMHTTGAGSKYPYAVKDNTGKFLDGSNTYKLHLPPNPPAALFWAVTAYTSPTVPCRKLTSYCRRPMAITTYPRTKMVLSTCGLGRITRRRRRQRVY